MLHIHNYRLHHRPPPVHKFLYNTLVALNLRQDRQTFPVVGPSIPDMLTHEFQTFQIALSRRGKAWRWCVCTVEGRVVMGSSERSRREARYNANRALFLLLLTSSYRPGNTVSRSGTRLLG